MLFVYFINMYKHVYLFIKGFNLKKDAEGFYLTILMLQTFILYAVNALLA